MTTEEVALDSLAAIKTAITQTKTSIELENRRHDTAIMNLNVQLANQERLYQNGLSGFDLSRIKIAEDVLSFEMPEIFDPKEEDMLGVIEDAILWFSGNMNKIRFSLDEYRYGVKNYDRFRNQRSDHWYNSCPRHGSLTFTLGLRDRRAELTEDQRNAAIYYLEMFKTGNLKATASKSVRY